MSAAGKRVGVMNVPISFPSDAVNGFMVSGMDAPGTGIRGFAHPAGLLDDLKKAGIEGMDIFVALTQGDNRNVMACQIAKHIFNVPRALCRLYDPLREEMYAALGLETISPTKVFAQLLKEKIED